MKIDFLRERLAAHALDDSAAADDAHAAVAVVFRDGPESVELLLIERAVREGDPWSGHMAFPGGRIEQDDESTRVAAQRETFEEVGIELSHAEYLGRLGDIAGNPQSSPPMVVVAHAFFLDEAQTFDLAPDEVQSAFWFPLAEMLEDSRTVEYKIPDHPEMHFPGILVGIPDRHIVWGLTYRFLEDLMGVLGHSIPGASAKS